MNSKDCVQLFGFTSYIGSLQYIGLLFRVDVPVPMILIHKRTPRQPAEGDGVVPNHRAHALRYVMSPLQG